MVGGAIINIIQSGQALLFLFESHLFGELSFCWSWLMYVCIFIDYEYAQKYNTSIHNNHF